MIKTKIILAVSIMLLLQNVVLSDNIDKDMSSFKLAQAKLRELRQANAPKQLILEQENNIKRLREHIQEMQSNLGQ